MTESTIKSHAAFIWSVANLLRGNYKQSEYGKVILPLTVLRRLDCVLEPIKAAVLDRAEKLYGRVENMEPVLCAESGEQFFNTSPLDFRRLLNDSGQVAGNLRAYTAGFSPGARELVDKFDFDVQITRHDRANLPYLVISRFADLDLAKTHLQHFGIAAGINMCVQWPGSMEMNSLPHVYRLSRGFTLQLKKSPNSVNKNHIIMGKISLT